MISNLYFFLVSTENEIVLYLSHLDVVWFWVVLIRSTDQQSEKCVKLFPTVSVDCSTNGPYHGKDKQTLQPAGDLSQK